MRRHIDLFSGIGGFSIASDKVFGDVEHTFVEIDPFCQQVLKKHFPQSKIYGDIKQLKVDNNANLIYCDCNELQKKSEIQFSKRDVSKGSVDPRDSRQLQCEPTSDVENSKTQKCEIEEQPTAQGQQSFFQEYESERSCSKCSGICNSQGDYNEKDSLRNMSNNRSVQERTDENSGSSSRLQQAARCDVVMSKMSLPMAQSEQGNSSKAINDTITPLYRTCQRQHKPVAKCGEIDLLTGGFP